MYILKDKLPTCSDAEAVELSEYKNDLLINLNLLKV